MEWFLKIFEIFLIYILSSLRILAFITIILLIFNEFYKIKKISNILKIKKLSTSNYIAIAILLIFIIWPNIQEANVGNFGIKKLESRIEGIELTIQDIFSRKTIEYWMYDKFGELNSEKKGDYYHYEIPLKYKPVENSVELWLSSKPQNPLYYTVEYAEKKLIYRHMMDMDGIKNEVKSYGEPAITVQYIRE